MTATYVSYANCAACADFNIDFGFDIDCVNCIKARTNKVEILQLGVGLFGNKAIIKDINTGKLDTVYISQLKDVSK